MAKVIKRKTECENIEERKVVSLEPKPVFRRFAVAEDLADPNRNDSCARMSQRNWMLPADSFLGDSVKFRTISKKFTYAVGGTLFVDEVVYESDIPSFKQKAKILQERGIRYMFVTPKTELFDAMRILNELDDKLRRRTQTA